MTFKEIQDEILFFRFNESRRTSAKRWINQRYAWVWGQCDWPWRRVNPADLSISTGDATPTLPTDFDRLINLYDDMGSPLQQLLPDEFDQAFELMAIEGQTSRPVAYKVVNRVLTLGPTPSSDLTFQIAYHRLLSHIDATVITPGLMANDADEPIWDAGFHYLLVLGGMATGLKMENDPTWQPLEQEFQQSFEMMQQDLLPPDRMITTQYGADNL